MPPNGERWAGPATHWLSCSDERDIHAAASRTSSLPVPSWSQCATCLDESLNELVRGRNIRGLLRADACIGNDIGPRQGAQPGTKSKTNGTLNSQVPVPVKRHRGEPGHIWDTRAHTGTRITQKNLTTIQTRTNTPARPHDRATTELAPGALRSVELSRERTALLDSWPNGELPTAQRLLLIEAYLSLLKIRSAICSASSPWSMYLPMLQYLQCAFA